jgi:ParB family transcriptional regulator, chromosome partitioning protein
MADLKPSQHEPFQVIPTGTLRKIGPDEIKPSTNNPRYLFDASPLQEPKKNIAEHGVLVPITVYQVRGQSKFSILDGERRYRCVVDLTNAGHVGSDGRPLKLPANIVEPPTKIAGLLYMFSIHNFREGWELMPTALSLKTVMEELEEEDNKALSKLTGLSEPQIERCKKLIDLPEEFQRLSLDHDPKTRIPSNFWIESTPVLDFAVKEIPTLHQLGRYRATRKLIEKYRSKKIKSVIHFRRIMDAYAMSADDPDTRRKVLRRVEEFFLKPELETRAAFDEFVVELRRMQSALEDCQEFIAKINKLKLGYISEDTYRLNLRDALSKVRALCQSLEEQLRGSDDPDVKSEGDD